MSSMSSGRSRATVVLYDADCGFCTRSVRILRRLDRTGRLRLVPLQGAAASIADAPPEYVLHETLHVRDAEGRWYVGGSAWIRISGEVAVLRPLGVLARLPLVRRAVEPVYALIARNRHRISRLLGDDDTCRLEPGPS